MARKAVGPAPDLSSVVSDNRLIGLDCENERTDSVPVFAHTLVHYYMSCVVGWSPTRLAAVAEIG